MSRPEHRADQQNPCPRFLDAELVYPHAPTGPRFGDVVWDISALAQRASQGERRLSFAEIPDSWVRPIRDVLMVLAQPDRRQVVEAGIVRRAKPAPLDSLVMAFQQLRTIAMWSVERGLHGPAQWTQNDADALLDDLREGRHRQNGEALSPSAIRNYVNVVKYLRTFAPMITDGGLPFQPWRARSAAQVAGVVKSVENTTLPLRWETWAPIVAAAWAIVDRFSVDILAALTAEERLPSDGQGPSGSSALPVVQSWIADGGRIPLVTGFGRGNGRRGKPNMRLLCRQICISRKTIRLRSSASCIDVVDMLTEIANDPKRTHFGGLWTPAVTVMLDDGSKRPWIDEIGYGELEYLVSVLRASAYVLLASLTGMRDSELQEITRQAATTSDGLPALASVQFKGEQAPAGRPRTWFGPPPVFRTLEVLSALSRHPTHLFARSSTNAGDYDPQRDIPRLIAFVNDDPRTRPGRGHGLGLSPIQPTAAANINQMSLRRSFCVYAAQYPGAELGLGIQLGHAALRITTGYATDSRQQVARLFNKERQDIAREQLAALILDSPRVAGSPKAELASMRAQVVADPTRAERIINTAGEDYHLGVFNDCLWRKARSGCGPNGPKLALGVCKGASCANALFRPAHLPMITAHVERIDAFLDSGRGHPVLLEDLRDQRTLYSRVIVEIQANAEDD